MALRISEVTADHAFGTAEHVVLYVWKKLTHAEAMAVLVRATETAASATPSGKICALGIVEPGAVLPSSAARKALAELMSVHWGPRIVASALAFTGTGFEAAAVRTIATGLSVVSRQPFPHKVFASVPDAIAWMQPEATRAGVPFSGPDLTAAMTQLRAAPPTRS